MDTTVVDGNRNYKSEMENEFDNCTDDKVCIEQTVISGRFINEELYDTDNKQRGIHNYVTIKDESIDDQTVVDFINENPCDTEYKQGSILNYVSIKDENIDYPTIAIPETELITDCTDHKVCPNATVIRGGYIKHELCSIKDEQGSINTNDLIAEPEETKLMIDCIDSKVCVYETIISGGYIKEEPCDMENESESIHNNVNMKGCEECGEEYDLYCLKCPMLIRIFNRNYPKSKDNKVRRTLPKNVIDIQQTPSGVGIVALRAIPKGVVFGPFEGLDSTKDGAVSKWKLKNKELACAKDLERFNWMQYIRKADKSCHKNLVPFQYEEGLYYRSECQINVGDELLVHWDNDSKGSEIQDMEDGYWKPQACERLDDTYACTFCCVGYKSIRHLDTHNSTCIEKRNRKDFCEEIVQCDICKIYLDKKEYSSYHLDPCFKSNAKIFALHQETKQNQGKAVDPHLTHHTEVKPFAGTHSKCETTINLEPKRYTVIHNDDQPFTCPLCSFKTRTNLQLKRHIATHNNDKSFACSHCSHKTRTKSLLKLHMSIHKDDKLFVCSLCSLKTKTQAQLTHHLLSHNDDKPFECTQCPYKTKTSWLLKQHIVIHSDDKPFACSVCSFKTRTKLQLKRHIVLHNDDKPFACSLCSYKAKRNSELKKHIVTHK